MTKMNKETQHPMLRKLSYGTEINRCNASTNKSEHECDGSCERWHPTNEEIDLHNELVEWNLLDYPITGIPQSLMPMGLPVSGIGVEILATDMRLTHLLNFLIEKEILDEKEMEASFIKHKIKVLRELRENLEKAQKMQGIAVAKTQLLGPNGEVLH